MQLLTIDSNQITLPQDVFVRLKGKSVQFIEIQGGFIIKPVSQISKAEYTLEDLLAGVSNDNIHYETDTGKPVGREIW